MESATQQSCIDCTLRPDRVFCDLPLNVLAALDSVKSTIVCPRNTVLFREGQPARGVFVLCEGRAKLSVCSVSDKRLTLHVAVSGEVLGLSAALSGGAYEVTAELLDNAQVAMVKRKDLLASCGNIARRACTWWTYSARIFILPMIACGALGLAEPAGRGRHPPRPSSICTFIRRPGCLVREPGRAFGEFQCLPPVVFV
jgi:CRP-like cAMP-binding protein